MKKIKLLANLLVGVLISLVSAADVDPLYFAYTSQDTVDCINYEGNPDARCAYARLEGGRRGLQLYVVPEGEDPGNVAKALPNTDFYVYAPKASSDSVSVMLLSSNVELHHMDKVYSDERGLVAVAVDALYPIYNVAIGTSCSTSESDAVVARFYNFYVPEVEFCLDESCEKPVTDLTKIQLEKDDEVLIYARAYIPIGPNKGTTDSALDKTFYIRPFASGESLRYYSESKKELPKGQYGYRVDFVNGRTAFVIRAVKAVEGDAPLFAISSYIDFTAAGDTNFIVTQMFPGSLSFLDAGESSNDSSMVQDTTDADIDTSTVDTSLVDTVKQIPPKVQIIAPVEQDVLDHKSVNVVWTVDGVKQDSLNWQFLEEGMNEIIREYCSSDGHCAADTVRVFYKKGDDGSDDGMEFASPSFRIEMTGPFEFKIVMDEEVSSIKKSYAVMDLQGRVLLQGAIDAQETLVPALSKGSYIVKVGIGYRRVNIR